MHEICVPLIICGIFLLLPILRNLVKRLWPVTGLAWLPIPGFLTAAAVFPAYGFRPEVIPLLVFSLVMVVTGLKRASLPENSVRYAVTALSFLAAVIAFALWFSPGPVDAESLAVEFSMHNNENNRKYNIKIFGISDLQRPAIIVFPPVFGTESVDGICLGLESRGFLVLSCSRSYFVSPFEWQRRFAVYGGSAESAAISGRALEEDRQKDILFLLPKLMEETGLSSSGSVFLAGYGDGGSALINLAGNSEFSNYANIKGIVSIESPLWSVSGINIPDMPALFLISDRVLDPGYKNDRYESIFSCLRYYNKPITIASVLGAGPLDYAGFPSHYPLLSLLFKGFQKAPDNGIIAETALIISEFAASPFNCNTGRDTVYFFHE